MSEASTHHALYKFIRLRKTFGLLSEETRARLPAAAAGAIHWMTTPDDCLIGCPRSLQYNTTENCTLYTAININIVVYQPLTCPQ